MKDKTMDGRSFKSYTLALCLLFGVACSFPSFLLLADPNREMFTVNHHSAVLFDEGSYYAKAASFVMTHLRLPFELEIFELRDAVTFNPPLPALVIGAMGRVFHWNLPLAWSVTKLLFPALSLFLVIQLVASVVGRDARAWLISLLFCTLGQAPIGFFMLTEYSRAQPLLITRIEPQAIGLPFFVLFLLAASMICQGRGGFWKWACGLSAGLLFYVYFFLSSIVPFVLLGLVLAFATVGDKRRLSNAVAAGCIGFAVAIPWIYQCAMLSSSGYLSQGIHSHFRVPPLHLALAGLAVAISLLTAYVFLAGVRARLSHWWQSVSGREDYVRIIGLLPPALALLASIGLAWVISPFVFAIPETGHYVQHVMIGISLLLLSVTLSAQVRHFGIRHQSVVLCLVGLLVSYVYLKQWVAYRINLDETTVVRSERAAEDLIRDLTRAESVVVVADPLYNVVLPSRVHRYRFYADISRSAVSPPENLRRFVFAERLLGRTWEETRSHLIDNGDHAGQGLVAGYSAAVYLGGSGLDTRKLGDLERFYRNADSSFLVGRELDYVLIENARLGTFVQASRLMGLFFREIGSNGLMSLYEIEPPVR